MYSGFIPHNKCLHNKALCIKVISFPADGPVAVLYYADC